MKEISFFAPGLKHYDEDCFSQTGTCGLSAVSITGSSCALKCKHCGTTILKSMKAATTPEALLREAETSLGKGAAGLLISGGSRPDGSVPLEPFLETIALIKNRFDTPVLLHTGLITPEVAQGLSEAKIDCVMIDIIGDRDTIKEVCHLDASPEDYGRSLETLAKFGVPAAPHVIMGLYFGQVKGEEAALDMIAQYPAKAVVMVGFRPIPGTAMEDVTPLAPEEMGRLISLARKKLPDIPLLLGCERPLGEHREKTDILALEAGVDGVAFPAESAIQWARKHASRINLSRTCCSLISHVSI